MKKILRIGATTCLIGFGVWFGLFIITTIHGLLGEANPKLYQELSIFSITAGVVASVFWVLRRIRGKVMSVPERALFLFASLSLLDFADLSISGDAGEFWAFDPLVATQRIAHWNKSPGDTFTFLGTTSMGVRVYSVAERGGTKWVIGVAPRFKLWWTLAFNLDQQDYQRMEQNGSLDKPRQ